MSNWQTIENAPKDGTDVLGYYEHEERCLKPSVVVMRYYEGSRHWVALPDFEWRLDRTAKNLKLFAPWFFPEKRLKHLQQATIKMIGGYKPTKWMPITLPEKLDD